MSLCTLMVDTLVTDDGGLRVAFVHRPSSFDEPAITSLATYYVDLLERGVSAPDSPFPRRL
ncbi:hypothetical protein [Actinomadura litoris]|uniref:hypothetical protein n=1 Tax=Actinomadura litoris TaxID=2678616 RepID=UPI001FA74BE9|nr:hypothetical protein [Actinomadura litoris]